MVKYLDENLEIQEKLRVSEIIQKIFSFSFPFLFKTLISSNIIIFNKNLQLSLEKKLNYSREEFGYETLNEMTFACKKQEDPKPYSFLAFGTGGRTCLGMNLAKAMMMVFLHRLVTPYKWEVKNHDVSLEKHSLFPRLRSGCPIKVTPISHSLINVISISLLSRLLIWYRMILC
ncbi:hypothetical protein ZOSMA_275G00080 [Zostera marina]|uniref:Cytochrome P450 n=1 Tax=Zostera marina TaxID=29655 RepID=A0A0K9PG47_ZOSMR|nr:hypothetical protein ZOSMA_275G00080 [Zostera marina]